MLGEVAPARLHAAVAERAEPPARVLVVAPLVVGALDWLATAEDAARGAAEVRAFAAEWSLADATEVSGTAGESDPVQAVADALSGFDADEILVAGAADADLVAELARFGPPVRRLEPGAAPARPRRYRALRGLAAGRSGATPFVVFVGVNAALLLLSILLSLLVAFVLWLLDAL